MCFWTDEIKEKLNHPTGNIVKYHLILEYKERGVEAMGIKEFRPLYAVLLYP